MRPSPDTATPDTPTPAGALLTPKDFGIPSKARYHLAELAEHLCRVEEDEIAHLRAVASARRTLERECERGNLRGVRIGRVIWVPAAELARYFESRNTLSCEN